MLHSFRRAIFLLFLSGFAIYMLSSLGMIMFFMAPFDIRMEQPWRQSNAESFINGWNYLAKDIVSMSLPGFNSKISEVDTVYGKYMSDVEILSSFIQTQNSSISPKSAFRIASALKHYSVKYEVSFDLAVAVMNTESHFDTNAKSGYGALGLMQVVWRVHSGLLQANGISSEELLTQPEFGAAAGCLLLSRYIRDSDSLQTALGRYYGGDSDVYWSRISRSLNSYRKHKNQRTI
ncbi:MAG: lytic transglycosylase domain-containing protein [Synergistaceae bacterium]|nr:lytic transglycosylase domain-containing protein [Synergistaceae bacterium]